MNRLKFWGISITESIIIAPSLVVCAFLTVPIARHNHDISYLTPVILTYALMKTSPLFVSEALKINNPYKLMKIMISAAFIGSILLIFAKEPKGIMYLTGASLTGIALSPFSILYKQFLTPPVYNYPRPKNTKMISFITAIAIVIGCSVCRQFNSRIIFYIWSVYLFIIFLYFFYACNFKPDSDKKTVEFRKERILYCIPIAILFVMMIATNGYKRSGTPVFLSILTVLFIIFSICIWYFEKNLLKHHLESIWIGAVFGFLIFYCPVYLKDIYYGKYVSLIYIIAIIAMFASPLLKYFFSSVSQDKTIPTCMFISIIGLVLLISRSLILFFAGIFISTAFLSYITPINIQSYLDNGNDSIDHYKIHQNGLYNMGIGIIQSYTMIIFSAFGLLISGDRNKIITEYIDSTDITGNKTIILLSAVVCIASLIIFFIKIRKRTVKS